MLESAKNYCAFVWSFLVETGNVEKRPFNIWQHCNKHLPGVCYATIGKVSTVEVSYFYHAVLL